MPHGDERHARTAELDEAPAGGLVVLGDPAPPGGGALLRALVGAGTAHVTLTQIGHGRDAEDRSARGVLQDEALLLGATPGDEGAEGLEHRTRRAQEVLRVVVARRHDHLLHARLRSAREEVVVEALRLSRRHRRVEDVAREQHQVRTALGHQAEEPVEERGVVLPPVDVGDRTAEVPVGGVEDADGVGHCTSVQRVHGKVQFSPGMRRFQTLPIRLI